MRCDEMLLHRLTLQATFITLMNWGVFLTLVLYLYSVKHK